MFKLFTKSVPATINADRVAKVLLTKSEKDACIKWHNGAAVHGFNSLNVNQTER